MKITLAPILLATPLFTGDALSLRTQRSMGKGNSMYKRGWSGEPPSVEEIRGVVKPSMKHNLYIFYTGACVEKSVSFCVLKNKESIWDIFDANENILECDMSQDDPDYDRQRNELFKRFSKVYAEEWIGDTAFVLYPGNVPASEDSYWRNIELPPLLANEKVKNIVKLDCTKEDYPEIGRIKNNGKECTGTIVRRGQDKDRKTSCRV